MSVFFKNVFPFFSKKERKKECSNVIKGVDPNEIWELVNEIGDGTFGKVYKAQRKGDGLLAAAKIVPINDEAELEDFMVEIDILSECKNKHVVDMFQAYVHDSKLWMMLEFCPGGAMDDIVLDLERGLDEDVIRVICRQMVEALAFLHEKGVIHRDLKAGNVLLKEDGNIKLADFGVSAKNKRNSQRRDTFIGTPYWMAPEVVVTETCKDNPYDYSADIWSLGITLIELAEMQPPYHEMHPMRVLFKITKSDPPSLSNKGNWSAEFHDFIKDCLLKDPTVRSSAKTLLEHPFIREISDNQPLVDLYRLVKSEVVEVLEDLPEDKDGKEANEKNITKSLSSDTLNSIATEDDSSSSQKDDSSVRDSDSGIPPMPLRRIKEMSEYDDLDENTDITKAKSKEPVAGAKSTAELVGFKASAEAQMQMIEKEDAVRNDLPSLQKRGEVPVQNVEAEGAEDEETKPSLPFDAEERDKYSSRLDDALARLEELGEASPGAARDEQKKRGRKRSGKAEEEMKPKNEEMEKTGTVASESKGETGKENTGKDVLGLKAELDKLGLNEKGKDSRKKDENEDDKSLSESEPGSTVTSPKKGESQQYKTLTRVRKYEVNGKVVTETTSRIVDVSSEDFRAAVRREQLLRKQGLNEMKILRRDEQKQGHDLMAKIKSEWDLMEEKFRQGEEELKKVYETKLEMTGKLQKRDIEKLEVQQQQELKVLEKKLKVEQEKSYKEFKESLKEEQKALKKETDKMPKAVRKEEFRRRKELLDYSHQNVEREFKARQALDFETFHREKTEERTRKIFEMEMGFLEIKHNLLRNWKSDEWELEQEHIHRKHQLTKTQLQETFYLQRTQMAARHKKEIEQHNRLYRIKDEELKRRHDLEKKRLPKIQRNEIKNQVQALRRQLKTDRKRDSIMGYLSSGDKEQLREFEDALTRNARTQYEKMILRQEIEEDELKTTAENELQELKQLQNEKCHMLTQSETEKLKDRDEKHGAELQQWRESLGPRKKTLEDEFSRQKNEQRQFYYQLSSSPLPEDFPGNSEKGNSS
ncbi:serine/threonine-protein kinase 10-like [Rhopilema esculentum]|uniref:serine/threonine-protein kinase 10-like n=1 Tax=Rhopilema esculentum TaxID=499914 RepID=UPI0031E0E804